MTDPRSRILIVEDDDTMRSGLVDVLELEGYDVVEAADGRAGLERARRGDCDLVLLDVMMPEMTGFDVLKALRAEGCEVPVILLTALGEELDRVRGLELGGDDYVVKPFSLRELIARIRLRLKPRGGATATDTRSASDDRVRVGGATVDLAAHVVERKDARFDLSPKEVGMLRLFFESVGKVISRRDFLDSVWGYETFPTTRTVDTHVLKLRQKIEPDPDKPRYILTVHGAGYKFVHETGRKETTPS